MTRANQYRAFNQMVCRLIAYATYQQIPVRFGEAHRPFFVAQKYFADGTGILSSMHRYSLAIDMWIIDEGGKQILWKDKRYQILADYWRDMGGTAGYYFKRCDPYHFEYQHAPA